MGLLFYLMTVRSTWFGRAAQLLMSLVLVGFSMLVSLEDLKKRLKYILQGFCVIFSRIMFRLTFIVILVCGILMVFTRLSYAYVETLKGDAQSVSNYIQLTSLDYGVSGQLEFRRLRLGERWKVEGEFWIGGGRGGQALYIYVWSRGTPTSENEAKRQYSINYNEYTNTIHLKYDGVDLIPPVQELGISSASWRHFQVEFRHGFFTST